MDILLFQYLFTFNKKKYSKHSFRKWSQANWIQNNPELERFKINPIHNSKKISTFVEFNYNLVTRTDKVFWCGRIFFNVHPKREMSHTATLQLYVFQLSGSLNMLINFGGKIMENTMCQYMCLCCKTSVQCMLQVSLLKYEQYVFFHISHSYLYKRFN